MKPGATPLARLLPRALPITSASGPVAAVFLGFSLLGLAVLALAVPGITPTAHLALLAALILGTAVVYEETMTRASRLRLRLAVDAHQDMQGVWCIAAVLALPRDAAIGVVAVLAVYIYVRQRRPVGLPLYREAFNSANVVLSCLAASLTFEGLSGVLSSGPLGVGSALAAILSIGCFSAVNRCILIVALVARKVPWRAVLGARHENLIDFATLSLGGLVALALVHEPALALLSFAPLVLLQRGAASHELETVASTDAKTGLLNALAWEHIASGELTRAAREHRDTSVLIIDVDHFKRVNDRFGHLAGDTVLKIIGQALSATLREYDTLARFGGEEFVAVLPDADATAALIVAERLRARVNGVWVSAAVDGIAPEQDELLAVSIGVSTCADGSAEVQQLLHAADEALYRAKAAGRNRVVLAGAPETGAPQFIA